MKFNVFFGIAIRIIVLFSIGMAMSLLNPLLHDLFGDIKHVHQYNSEVPYCLKYNEHSIVDSEWIWSPTHYWYFWMCFILFILSLVNVIVGIFNLVTKNYNF